MKQILKKAITILGGALMIGSTAAMAAAASYPAPFVDGGSPNVAIVVGAGADLSDGIAATRIGGDLATKLAAQTATGNTVVGGTAVGGDSIKIERSSDKLNLGDNFTEVWVTSITDDNLPNLLMDGTYTDDLNTEYSFTQKITLGDDLEIIHFSNSDYKENVPSIGTKVTSDWLVMNYTMDFTTNPKFTSSLIETTEITLLGKKYYVLDLVNSTTDTLTLLDSATDATITEGETGTVGDKEVAITFIDATSVKLSVDGETTNSLSEGSTYKLNDGSYVGIKDIMYNSKDTGISKVEMSIGSGKLELRDGTTIKLNEDTIQEIKSHFHLSSGGTNTTMDKIVLEWITNEDVFLTPDTDLVMPGFGTVKLTMGEMNFPVEEEIKVDRNSDAIQLSVPIKDGTASIDLLYVNASGDFVGIGKSATQRLATTNATTILINRSAAARDKYFVASWNSTSESESYLLSLTIEEDPDNNKNTTTITNVVTGKILCEDITNSETCTIGNLILTVEDVMKKAGAKSVNLTISDGSFNRLYTKEGMTIWLPWLGNYSGAEHRGIINSTQTSGTVAAGDSQYSQNWSNLSTAGHSFASWYMFFDEEDKDGTLDAGTAFNITVDEAGTNNVPHVSAVAMHVRGTATSNHYEILETDDYEVFVESELATKGVWKTGGDYDSVVITYHGGQSFADVFVSAPDVTVAGGGSTPGSATALGDVTVYDNEVSSVNTKNLIVVGGSCINKVAAKLLGSDTSVCEEGFTALTGVASGQYLIQTFTSPYADDKVAMLVAGYNAADTGKAATFLTTNPVDTTMKYTGSTATDATGEVVVA